MNKKVQKQLDAAKKKLQNVQQQLAGARKQRMIRPIFPASKKKSPTCWPRFTSLKRKHESPDDHRGHPSEKRSKCSVEPLRGQPGFVFWNYPKRGTESLEGYVRLGIGGPQLTPNDCEQGLGTAGWIVALGGRDGEGLPGPACA